MCKTQADDLPSMTVDEYLAFADKQDTKHEFRAGRVFAMAGASVRHNTITASAITHLGSHLADQDCTVNSSHTRVHIASTGSFRYPDVTVFCGDPAYWNQRTDTITNPVILVEVLSPGTALNDYNDKLEEYTQIESLQAYVIVAQDKPKVEVYTRNSSGKWTYEYVTGQDATIDVPVLGKTLSLSLAQIYRRVRWNGSNDDV